MDKKYIIVGLTAILFASSCTKSKEEKTTENKQYPVLTVQQKDTLISNQFVADIQAKKNIEIHTRIPGLLQSIFVNEGQQVKNGQVLFKISDAELRMELLKASALLQQAEADLKMASVEVKQLQILFDKKVIADNELELSKAKRAAAQAKVAHAQAEKATVQQKIEFTSIKSPFDGVIDRIPLKEGSMVPEGTLLTTVSNLSEVYAYFSLPENLYFELLSNDKIGKQQKIELILPNGETHDFKGSLLTAEGEIDKATGSIQYKVAFKNPNNLIKHGTSGKLVISEEEKNTLIIPQKSTFSIQDKTYVFVVDKSNKVSMKSIEIAATLTDSYLVKSGVNPGDVIVFEGTQSLRDGDVIAIKK